jgi:hypothetical protein
MAWKPPLVAAAAVLGLAACGGGKSEDAQSQRPPAPAGAAALQFASEGWGTDFRRHSVPLSEFQSGGPPRDGIPPIDRPKFVPVSEAGFLEAREPVIELVVKNEARAYPLQILIWHEIANDEIAGVPVAVTFCPLCNTAIAFDRRVPGGTLDFGTTGKLRNSDLVMYDRETQSWWQQFGGEGLVGRFTGERLAQLPARVVAWGDFRRAHPDGLVLSRETGFRRPYGQNPYVGYDDVDSSPLFAPANADDKRLAPKERVVFVEMERGGDSVAVPFSTLAKRRSVRVEVDGHRLLVRWSGGVASALDTAGIASGRDVGTVAVTENGRPVVFDEPFWFAVAAFRPDARIVR